MPEDCDHWRVRETARHMRSEQPPALTLDNRHPVQPDLAAWGRDAAHGAHQRVNASRQAFAYVWSRIAGRVEPTNHAGDAQPSQNVAKDHRSDDVAASRIEKDNATQLGVQTAGPEKIDER